MNLTKALMYCSLLCASLNVRPQVSNAPPVLSAGGSTVFCPGSDHRIVPSLSIVDPDDTAIEAMYVQISTGYQNGDQLSLTGAHPGIVSNWNPATGKLSLQSPTGAPVPYLDFIAAIEDVVFSSTAVNLGGSRTFSITVGQANYLPSTQHYYQFVPSLGITWTNAKTAAENSTYYGLQGYLATITAADEAQLSGEQSSGAGWIGGSDAAQEGVWKWVTGPENGTVFWNGGPNGSTPNFAFWNSNEPNNLGDENYAHVTAPGVGISGSWNDLSNTGDSSGNYQPKGYIVEYGGMPGDPVLNISTSTSMVIPVITASAGASSCGPGSVALSASSSVGPVHWFDAATGGNLLFTGDVFNTPVLSQTTTYWVSAYDASCTTGTRTAVVATINEVPGIVSAPDVASCEGSVVLNATASSGTVNWFANPVGGTALATGNSFTTPVLTQSTTYYVEAINNACPGNRVAVDVTIFPVPVVQDDENAGICENGSAVLDAGISNVSYLWSTGATTSQITVTGPGIYTVTVTTAAGCSAVKTFTVLQKAVPHITGAVVTGNTLTIMTSNTGNFEYSLDGINWQSSPVFAIDGSTITTLYANETHGCGNDIFPFSKSLVVPAFFTPNGDGYHDRWGVNGAIFYDATTSIYDRYGKLIKTLDKQDLWWDGTLNGKPLPSNDYWFVIETAGELPPIRGHFSLKR